MYELTRRLRSPEDGGGASEGDTPPPDSGGGSQTGSEKTMTQVQVENLIKARVDRLNQQWEKKFQTAEQDVYTRLGIKGPEEIERIHTLREEAEKAEQREKEKRGEYEKVLADRDRKHQQEKQELLTQKSESENNFLDLVREINLTNAALKAGADPASVDIIVAFTKGDLKVLDKNTVIPVDNTGNPLMNPETGKDMTLDDFMKSFLHSRPNLAKGSGTAGAGSNGTQTKHGKISLDDLKHIAKTDPKRYAELKQDGTAQQIISANAQKQ